MLHRSLPRALTALLPLLWLGACGQDPEVSAAPDTPPASSAAQDAPRRPHGAGHGTTLPGLAEALQEYEPIVQSFAGRVLDAQGAPIERFTVELLSVLRPSDPEQEWPSHESTFTSSEGAFSFSALDAHHWNLVASAPDYAPSLPLPIELPRSADSAPFEVRLERATQLRGRVLDPEGAPVANAQVGTGRLLAFRQSDVGEHTWGFQIVTTDDEGGFELEGLGSGSVDLVARAAGYAPSQALRVSPAAEDGSRDAVDLVLREGARIEGLATTPDGAIAPGRMVRAFQPANELYHDTFADDEGRFAFQHLTPGRWHVQSLPTSEEIGARGIDPADSLAMQSLISQARLELFDAELLRVRLSAPPEAPVWIEGRVVRGNAPAAGMLSLVPEARDPLARMSLVDVAADGSFRARVDGAGRWLGVFYDRMGGSGRAVLEVPAVEVHRETIELATGSIAGVVLHPSGEPQPGAAVSLLRERPLGGRLPQRYFSEVSETDASGRFLFRGLPRGTYRVLAGLGPGIGQASAESVRLESGQARDDLELALTPGGGFAGRVLDLDGLPVAGAAVFVRDAEGRLMNPTSIHYSDSAGLFRYDGLPAGEYRVSARTERGASQLSPPLRLGSGPIEPVRLVLEPGSVLRVRTQGEGGEPLDAGLVLGDGYGNEWSDLRDLKHLWDTFQDGWYAGEQRIGPVPPGEYLLTATAADGRSAAQWVNVLGERQQQVDLLLVSQDD